MKAPDLLLFAHSGDPARLRSLAALAASAAALGRAVTIVWEGPALAGLVDGALDGSGTWPPGVEPPSALLAGARALGTVQYLACPTAIRAAGVDEAAAEAVLDARLGLPSIVTLAEGAHTTLFV